MLVHRLSIVAFALTFYCLGTTYFEAFVNYRTWAFINTADFPSYHRALDPLVAKVMLAPIAVYVVCLAGLVLRGAPFAPRWALVASLALVLVAIASSVSIQIPIQRVFDRQGPSPALLHRLITTDLMLRKVPLGLNALLWMGMFCRGSWATAAVEARR